jgi:hypothetical protein
LLRPVRRRAEVEERRRTSERSEDVRDASRNPRSEG